MCDANLLPGSLLTSPLQYRVWALHCLQEEISYDAVLLMDCLLSHPGAVTNIMLLPTTCVACLLIIMQQTCSMEQMPSKQHLEHVPGALVIAGAQPCSVQLAVGSCTAMCSPKPLHVAAGDLVHSALCEADAACWSHSRLPAGACSAECLAPVSAACRQAIHVCNSAGLPP